MAAQILHNLYFVNDNVSSDFKIFYGLEIYGLILESFALYICLSHMQEIL
jgi:hypothetical protein